MQQFHFITLHFPPSLWYSTVSGAVTSVNTPHHHHTPLDSHLRTNGFSMDTFTVLGLHATLVVW